jgi:hypothetical protein
MSPALLAVARRDLRRERVQKIGELLNITAGAPPGARSINAPFFEQGIDVSRAEPSGETGIPHLIRRALCWEPGCGRRRQSSTGCAAFLVAVLFIAKRSNIHHNA